MVEIFHFHVLNIRKNVSLINDKSAFLQTTFTFRNSFKKFDTNSLMWSKEMLRFPYSFVHSRTHTYQMIQVT